MFTIKKKEKEGEKKGREEITYSNAYKILEKKRYIYLSIIPFIIFFYPKVNYMSLGKKECGYWNKMPGIELVLAL